MEALVLGQAVKGLSALLQPITAAKVHPGQKILIYTLQSLQPRPGQNLPPIQHNRIPINMPRSPRTQKHHHPRNILRPPQTFIRITPRQLILSARQPNKAGRHLGGEEARGNAIDEDIPRAEFDSQIAREVQYGGFGGAVGVGGVGV